MTVNNILHKSTVFGRVVIVLLIATLMMGVRPTYAASECPASMSVSDCSAIIGGWPKWLPDDSTCSTSVVSDSSLTGGDNATQAFNFFTGQGLSSVQAAGIVGNLIVESGGLLDPKVNQGGGGPGRGIGQWSVNDRWVLVQEFAKNKNTDVYSLALQLNFIWAELNGQITTGNGYSADSDYSSTLANLKKQTDLFEATGFFMGTSAANVIDSGTGKFISEHGKIGGYENPGTPNMNARVSAALKYAGTAGASGPVGCTSASATVDCTSGAGSTAGLSPTRQQAVCLVQAEYALWQSGAMGPGKPGDAGMTKYTQGRNEEWCADFVSWIYYKAGYPLISSNQGNVPGVLGIQEIGQASGKFTWHPAGAYIPMPGDMVIYGPHEHVNMVVSVDPAKATMVVIGGNQGGIHDNTQSLVSQNTLRGFSGGSENITGYVGPTN